MSDKTLVVHSGTYKTGSTAIQVYLDRCAQQGELGTVSYPVTGRSTNTVQHGNLASQLSGARNYVPGLGSWERVVEELVAGDAETTIVSTEHFSTLSREQLTAIGAICAAAGVRVRWVHYLREQSELYNAFYVERLVNMRPEFAALIDRPFEDFGDWSPIDMRFLHYDGFVEDVLSAIPDVDLVVRPFARARLVDGDVVADFCAATGIPFIAGRAGASNVGAGWRTTETARRLTPMIAATDIGRRVRHKQNPAAARMRWMQLARTELIRGTKPLGWNKKSAIYLEPSFADVLRERYRRSNEHVAELTGLDWPAVVADTAPKAYNIGTYATIDADDLMGVVRGVMDVVLTVPDEIRELPDRDRDNRHPATSGDVSVVRRVARRVRRRS